MTQDAHDVSLKGLRVMVIDDSKTIRRTAETLLVREGCDVVTATDGFEALAKIADHNPQIIFVPDGEAALAAARGRLPDLVISDVMMPRLDGFGLLRALRHDPALVRVPVIMLSSKDGLFDKARGRIVGSQQYLTKPFTREELLGAIRTYVNA